MKFPKNMLILIGSYLGMLVLVCCVAQFLTPASVQTPKETGNADQAASADGKIPTAENVAQGEEEKEADGDVLENERLENDRLEEEEVGDVLENGGMDDGDGDTPVNGGADTPTYYLKSVKEEAGSAVPVIGVYDENGQLLETLDTPIYALPLGDRAMLEVGIAVTGREELSDLIEDFGG